jgi:uncharacterized membrane protein
MIDDLAPTLAVAGAVGAGLNGGVFFAFSTFVMSALTRLPAPGGVSAMQAINREAPSPLFMSLLFGSGIVSIASGAIALAGWDEPWAAYMLVGSALYLVCPITTIGYHVPRNNALDRMDPNSPAARETWPNWRATWVAGNHVRTLACVASAVMFAVAARAM